MNFTVVGAGYVGLSLATLLSTKHRVTIVEIDESKVEKINSRVSPIEDTKIRDYFNTKQLNLVAASNANEQYGDSEYIILAVPTDYDPKKKYFNTKTLESVLKNIIESLRGTSPTIVIKSTIPVGYTVKIRERYQYNNIIFCPEFLRESKALEDNLYPSRIIVGCDQKNRPLKNSANVFAKTLADCSKKIDTKILSMDSTEAEAVKLFANTYLAMRVAFFNELDTFAESHSLNPKSIIEGVSLDPRIGTHYNNPSFGYGGYCLPKDTKQLLANYQDIPENLIEAIVKSNATRKRYIASQILSKLTSNKSTVGFYRLTMKSNSDNFRQSAILDVIRFLSKKKIKYQIYEPTLDPSDYLAEELLPHLESNFEKFCVTSDLIVANRYEEELKSVKNKLYTRDLFREN